MLVGKTHLPTLHALVLMSRRASHASISELHSDVAQIAPDAPNELLTPARAAARCACSLRHFERHVAPSLAAHDLAADDARRRMLRYAEHDVLAWLLARRRAPRIAAATHSSRRTGR